MGLVSFAKRCLLQLLLSLAIFFIPIVWATASDHSLFSLGVSLAVSALCYLLLPWDLIPNWLPLIGWIDNFVALLVLIGGGLLAGAGLAVSMED
ncbi:hypothetical protein CLOM_g15001 [Closterium sp. NIES-68]|nr:hypothetical protein CLOM_g15001 [Closterium sp. NIES-68]GJP66237.1 hypothetical protein CLOP_g23134 [Closterium sp. NIES-67]